MRYTQYGHGVARQHGYSYSLHTNISYATSPIAIELMMNYYLRYDRYPLLQKKELLKKNNW